ncbi:hypothetical protein AJ87_34020 [Rhizobium yanglingense]|nr:hypothetical protein AJ87_34020 [Rhizobium yanglingense]
MAVDYACSPQRDVVDNVSIRAVLENGVGRLSVSLHADAANPEMLLRCGEVEQGFEKIGGNHYSAILKLPEVTPWWPHTHGTPHLYELTLVSDGTEYSLGKTGFRRIEIDRGVDGDGFGLRVNGEPVFCRGAVWTTADIVRLPGFRADYEPFLRLAAGAGMNMIRIGGTMAYETPEFFELCDELGILVWQDFMFANFDYPRSDKAFTGHVHAEVEGFIHGVQASPSLAVLCGGSEIYQQAAMLGLPQEFWRGPLTEDVIPAIAERMRPDVPYVPNSPHGGPCLSRQIPASRTITALVPICARWRMLAAPTSGLLQKPSPSPMHRNKRHCSGIWMSRQSIVRCGKLAFRGIAAPPGFRGCSRLLPEGTL